MRVLSLFDGISCGLQALKELNIDVENYYASEIDSDAIKISQKNHPEIIRVGDVNDLDFSSFLGIDLLIGGSPCQGFSFQGKGLGLEDPRSKLFYKFVEALRVIKPKYFLLENVKMEKKWLDIITTELGVKPIFIDSKHFSAQSRKRYYWTNLPVDMNFPDNKSNFYDIEDKSATNFYSDSYLEKLKNISWETTKRNIKNTEKFMTGKFPTLWGKAFHYGSTPFVKLNDKYRILTILECERLQTLPDDYTKIDGMTDVKRFVTLTNGWNVETIKWILKKIK